MRSASKRTSTSSGPEAATRRAGIAASAPACSSTGGASREHRRFLAFAGAAIAAALALAGILKSASAAEERCIRAAEHSEQFYEVKNDRLSVRIANMEGECDIYFKEMWRAGPHQEIAVGFYRLLGHGNVTLGTGKAEYRDWMAQARAAGRRNNVIRIAPGQIHEFHSDLASVARFIEIEGRKNGMPPLPWGKRVLVEFSPLTVFVVETDPFTASYGDTMEVGTGTTSPPLIYRLSDRPPG